MLTLFGVAALSFMMLMYALERRGPRFTAAFACGCPVERVWVCIGRMAIWRRGGDLDRDRDPEVPQPSGGGGWLIRADATPLIETTAFHAKQVFGNHTSKRRRGST